jgi:hypothetical protein
MSTSASVAGVDALAGAELEAQTVVGAFFARLFEGTSSAWPESTPAKRRGSV